MGKTNTSGLMAAGFQEMRRLRTPMDRCVFQPIVDGISG